MNKKALAREQNIAAIVLHAEALFAERGFNGTSTQDIADRAGLPKANVHYYFKTKRDIYTAVLKDVLEDWMHDGDIFDISDDPEVVLTAYIEKKLEHSFNRPLGSRVWATEIIQGGPIFGNEIKEIFIAWDKKIVRCIQRWNKQGKINDIDPQILLNMIWATTQYYADFDFQVKTLNNNKSLSKKRKKQVAEQLCKIVLTGVLPPIK